MDMKDLSTTRLHRTQHTNFLTTPVAGSRRLLYLFQPAHAAKGKVIFSEEMNGWLVAFCDSLCVGIWVGLPNFCSSLVRGVAGLEETICRDRTTGLL